MKLLSLRKSFLRNGSNLDTILHRGSKQRATNASCYSHLAYNTFRTYNTFRKGPTSSDTIRYTDAGVGIPRQM